MAFPNALSRSFNQVAQTYDRFAVVQNHMVMELDERLRFFKNDPKHILDLGAGTGKLTEKLLAQYPQATVVAIDIAEQMLQHLNAHAKLPIRSVMADAHELPIQDQQVDLVASNAMLQWSYDLEKLFKEVARVLVDDGIFHFATFGPQTLKELRQAWLVADPHYEHVNPFIDMHDLGDLLMHCGLSDPVMDMTMMSVSYADGRAALNDIRGVGSRNHLHGKRHGLTPPGLWKKMYESLAKQTQEPGKITMSYEIVYGHAFKGQPKQAKEAQPFIISPEDIVRR